MARRPASSAAAPSCSVAAGARWVRCDLVLGGPGAPRPRPATLELGRFPYADTVSRCRGRVSSRSFRFGRPGSRAARQAGDRALVCYSRTRRQAS